VSLSRLVNDHIRSLAPYEPGKPVEALERELGIQGSVKLASNENPLGPSPRAVEALRGALGGIHRYPDGHAFALRHALARRLGVAPEQLVLGNGSDEVLELLAKTFLAPGDEVVHAWPSFAMYPIVARGMGATSVRVPLTDGLVHDLDALAAAVGPRTKLVLVCNPNNPTGTSVGAEAFDRFVARLPEDVVLAVDEAYFEFARRPDFPDALAWLARRPATLVMRTFSKSHGLAGLRVGYAVGSAELCGYLERARHPFNLNLLAQVAGLAALDDVEHVRRTQELNASGIDYLTRELEALGLEVTPSDANFVLVRTGADLYERLLREGVIVRPMGGYGLDAHVRVSVGLPEENERFVKALRRLLEGASRPASREGA
jgi:histidinol-phosphate aminotransferase